MVAQIGAIAPFFMGNMLLPDGWVFCDGTAIDDPCSPLDGTFTPDMVGRVPTSDGQTYHDPVFARDINVRWIMKIREPIHPLKQLALQADCKKSGDRSSKE